MPMRPKQYRSPNQPTYDKNKRYGGTAQERGYTWQWRKECERFKQENPLCLPCQQAGGYISATQQVDHVLRHLGDMDLFWHPNNRQPICVECHKLKGQLECGKQRERVANRFVVTGPPGCGKTTWVANHTDSEWVTWDMDAEAVALGFKARWPRPERELKELKIRRAWIVSRLMFDSKAKAALIVTGRSEAEYVAGMVGARVTAPVVGWGG